MDGSYSLVLGRDRGILLNVSVSNQADSAYETHLYVKHDPSISYSGTKVYSECKRNRKPFIYNNAPFHFQSLHTCTQFNSTLVDCSLGNPMRRGTEAKLSLRFDPQRVDDLVSKLTFQVFVNTTSALLEGTKSEASIVANVIKRAKISISGYVTDIGLIPFAADKGFVSN